MTPRINVGTGVTGATRYVLGEGRGAGNDNLVPGEKSRVDWIGGTGFGFEIDNRADAELARKIMEFDALNQGSRTKQCEKDCVHLSLSWTPSQKPSRAEMEEAARDALKALGMGNAKALFVAHNDEDYRHLHIIASKINPDTDRAYDLAASYRKLSRWAEGYEREHGGIEHKARADMNELRDAIAARDPGAVLEAMTKQRATFTVKQLERALQKEIYAPIGSSDAQKRGVQLDIAQFGNAILSHGDVVRLSDRPDGQVARYTTRAVIEGELHALQAAAGLAGNKTHGLSDEQRFAILNSDRHQGVSREQAHAFRWATGDEGIAIIDGFAGTGKSRVTVPVREAYEAAGYKVIGLAWQNQVMQRMANEGFEHTDTVKRELFMLANGREKWDSRTVVFVDEAGMLDTAHMAMITAYAKEAGAKLILAGDARQLPSIERGGMLGVFADRFGAATLTEIRRQHKGDERRASEFFAEGKFHDALGIYEGKGAIHWTRTHPEARAELLRTYASDVTAAPDKSRFIFAYTNADVAALNEGARQVQRSLGRLGQDHQLDSADGKRAFATGDRIQFTATDKKRGMNNGDAGKLIAIDGTHVAVKLDSGKEISFDTAAVKSFRHGYAGTIYKGQGDTVDQAYLYHSEHWQSAASYVGMTRHREKAALFVAKNTARDLDDLARQMARVDEGKRFAATSFHQLDPIGPVRPMNAAEIMAHFGGGIGQDIARDRQQPTPQRARPRAAPAAEMRGTRTARPQPRNNEPRPQRPAGDDETAKRQAEIIRDDGDRRRRRADHPQERTREKPSNDRIDEQRQARDETTKPKYDRYTGKPLDEPGPSQSPSHGRGRGIRRSR
jgi:Ti-type conjugative transfer relaxase TraA